MRATANRFAGHPPWPGRTGRLPRLRVGALFLAALPGLSLWLDLAFGRLEPLPFTAAVQGTADWALYYLVATLAVSPAARLFDWPDLHQIRGILGLSVLAYAAAHAALFWLDQWFGLAELAGEIVSRSDLLIGFLVLTGLSILGAASAGPMARRLGALRQPLRRLAFPLAGLAILHALLLSKLDATVPILLSGFLFWLMAYRALETFHVRMETAALAGLALVAAASTAAVEIVWYHAARSIPVAAMLAAQFRLDIALRPAWLVLALGLAVAVAGRLRAPPVLPVIAGRA